MKTRKVNPYNYERSHDDDFRVTIVKEVEYDWGTQRFEKQGRLCACGCGHFTTSPQRKYYGNHGPTSRVDQIIEKMSKSGRWRLEDCANEYHRRVEERLRGGGCVCGCYEYPKRPNSLYCPGHDAKYRGQLLELLAEYS